MFRDNWDRSESPQRLRRPQGPVDGSRLRSCCSESLFRRTCPLSYSPRRPLADVRESYLQDRKSTRLNSSHFPYTTLFRSVVDVLDQDISVYICFVITGIVPNRRSVFAVHKVQLTVPAFDHVVANHCSGGPVL